jgi:hypothetical protein
MTAVDVRFRFEQAVAAFAVADVDCQLAIIWRIYDTLGQAFAAAAPVSLFSQAVQRLIQQLQYVSRQDRLNVLRDIMAGADTRFTEEYKSLDINMRLAFWHRLTNQSSVSWTCLDRTRETQMLMSQLDSMGLNERLHFLRRVLAQG